ncbi:YoaK family protein [Blautia sp. MSJ-19]|uniref:YoaK family protein n=1 Tax=Blautia sp. MSJ-19 TaxID=2841517 RepID=UPI001C0ECBC9|nr:YoaK family protein [Blautia sp. MSJ-19]MBU5481878.1 DUF1275 domain-containing protein [Blautia sp. MSJ-19]
MDEATLERRLHLNMTLIGGFMVGYGVLSRHDILGSAQTGNMTALAMDVVGHTDEQWFFRILALVIYIVAVSTTVIVSHKISKMNLKRLSILIDGAVLLIIGFYPAEMNPFVALFPIFFATAFQWCSFKGADGFVSSSIFCTNNLRQCVTGFTEYICSRDKQALHRGIYFGKVLISFYGGVAFSFVACQMLDLKGAWIGIVPVVSAFALCNAEYVLGKIKKEDILKASA